MGKARSRKLHKSALSTREQPTIKRRQHSQVPGTKNQSKTISKSTQPRRSRVPFSAFDNVLLVGEGDFSFALSLLQSHKVASVTATCYDTRQELLQKYPNVSATIARLGGAAAGDKNDDHADEESFEGFSPMPIPAPSDLNGGFDDGTDDSDVEKPSSRVLYDIDATKLSSAHKKILRPSTPFSKIVFNFPHVGGLSTDVNRQVRSNQQLLVGFFDAAKALLCSIDRPLKNPEQDENDQILPKGQILVTLFEGEPYTLWNIRDLARHCGLQMVESFKFPWSAYPGYKHARTIGDITDGKDRNDEGKRKGAWRGEERDARCFVMEIKDEDGAARQPDAKKRRRGDLSDDEND